MAGSEPREIVIAAAILLNGRHEMLVVRKRETEQFMQPGGKINAGETPEQALCRELFEEISLELEVDAFRYEGVYRAQAAHETGATVLAHTFIAHCDIAVTPAAEIAEVCWLPVKGPYAGVKLAPLTEIQMLPLARAALAANATPTP